LTNKKLYLKIQAFKELKFMIKLNSKTEVARPEEINENLNSGDLIELCDNVFIRALEWYNNRFYNQNNEVCCFASKGMVFRDYIIKALEEFAKKKNLNLKVKKHNNSFLIILNSIIISFVRNNSYLRNGSKRFRKNNLEINLETQPDLFDDYDSIKKTDYKHVFLIIAELDPILKTTDDSFEEMEGDFIPPEVKLLLCDDGKIIKYYSIPSKDFVVKITEVNDNNPKEDKPSQVILPTKRSNIRKENES
jgi:hypothetical protein